MSVRVGINGFGRIGRNVFRAAHESDADIEIVAVNDITDAGTLGHLLKYDSVFGPFPGEITVTDGALSIDGHEVKVLAERDPGALPWSDLGVDVVIESTGLFTKRADLVIDTSGLSAAALRRKVADELLEPATSGKLAVTFTSFGHKHGPPRDADLAFDVRFLPNPHYEPELRPLTGFDQRIVDYVGRDGRLAEFYAHVVPLLEFLLPQFVAEGKAHLMIAIGCTGGRHRSVAIAEHLASIFRDRPEYFVEVAHRDVDRLPMRRPVA